MTPKVRRTGLVSRSVQHRDARLYIVATEDTYAPAQYFYALQERWLIDRSRVRVIVLATDDGRGSPTHLLERLDKYRDRIDRKLAEDEFWAVFDVDHHRSKELSDITTKASQKGYRLAGSNPCFELWLLLHETDDTSCIVTYTDDPTAAALCEKTLRRVIGSYNKKRLDGARLNRASIHNAVERAEKLDSGDPWPARVETHVHRLVKRLPMLPS